MTLPTQLRELLEEVRFHTPKLLPENSIFAPESRANPAYVALDEAIALLHTPTEAAVCILARVLYEQGLHKQNGAWEIYRLYDGAEEYYTKLAKQAIDALHQATTEKEKNL